MPSLYSGKRMAIAKKPLITDPPPLKKLKSEKGLIRWGLWLIETPDSINADLLQTHKINHIVEMFKDDAAVTSRIKHGDITFLAKWIVENGIWEEVCRQPYIKVADMAWELALDKAADSFKT